MNDCRMLDGMGYRNPTRAPASRRSTDSREFTPPEKRLLSVRVSLV